MVFLDDIAAYLQTNGIGTVGTHIFTVKLPESVDAGILLQERAGMAPDPITTIERPGFRVLCRNADTDAGALAAYNKAYAIKKLLHRAVGVTMGTTLYHRIDATGNPTFNGQDQRGRPMYEVSFIATKEDE